MATLLAICGDALKENGQFQVPSTIVGSSNPLSIQLLALANRAGRTLAYDHDWQVLLATHTFPTVASTGTYSLPTDFHRFVNMTQWDRTATEQMVGPIDPRMWEALRSGDLVGASVESYFRVAGGVFAIYPTPTAVATIAFQYFSKYWISGKEAFSADSDEPLIDADLITLGVRYRFLASKGLPYAEEKLEYERRRDSLQAADGGKDVVSFSGPMRRPAYEGIPDTGYGV